MAGFQLFLVSLMVIPIVLLSCARNNIPETKPASEIAFGSPAAKASGKMSWEDEFQKTAEAAKKEGKVIAYVNLGADLRTALVKGFGERFGIAMEVVNMTGGQLAEKIFRERRAGIYQADVYMGGVTSPTIILKPAGVFDPMEPAFVLPELKDPDLIKKTWWDGRLLWVESEHKVLAFLAYAQDWVAINTDLVKLEEMKSLRDLLNPKWKGKVLMFDPSTTGSGGKLFGALATYIVGLDFWREFAKQEPMIFRDHRVMSEWVARGKNPIAVAPRPDEIQTFQQLGLPVIMPSAPTEGIHLITGAGGIALVNQAPHPNAAKLFINWLLSKEGLTIFSKLYDSPSARLDVPTDFLKPDRLRQPGVKYFWADTEEYLLKEPALQKEAREILGIR